MLWPIVCMDSSSHCKELPAEPSPECRDSYNLPGCAGEGVLLPGISIHWRVFSLDFTGVDFTGISAMGVPLSKGTN